jgi:hypothetical protein
MGRGLRPGLWLKEAFLFLSLLMLVYGFANAYMGLTPFTWTPGNPMPDTHGPNWWGLAFLARAFIVIVAVRCWYKTRLAELRTRRCGARERTALVGGASSASSTDSSSSS